jgi:phosphatidylglycerol:prolipoprotein diacylglycerol transferase
MPFFVLPFPAIDPIAVQLGPLAIRWYALAYIVGIVVGWWWIRRLVTDPRRWGGIDRPTVTEIDDFVVWATVGIVFGGRIGYVLFYNPAHYLSNPVEILMPWKGGMSFHGGFLGSVAAMVLFARSRSFSFLTLFDLFAAAAPIGLFFGRIANFVNGELWGRPADVAWAMVFPHAGPLARHPSQLYEAGLEGLALFALVAVLVLSSDVLRRPGMLAGVFAIGYGTARIVAEFFREPDAQLGFLAGGVTMGQILSLPMVLIGIGLVVWAARRTPGSAPP